MPLLRLGLTNIKSAFMYVPLPVMSLCESKYACCSTGGLLNKTVHVSSIHMSICALKLHFIQSSLMYKVICLRSKRSGFKFPLGTGTVSGQIIFSPKVLFIGTVGSFY
jgi:hypothetical protein